MDQKLQIWELLSKQSGGELSEKEAERLRELVALPENQEAVSLYKRVNAYWERVAKAPSSKEQEAVWVAHREKLLDRYLRTDTKDPLTFSGPTASEESKQPTGPANNSPQTVMEPSEGRSVRYLRVARWPWKKIAAILIVTIGLGWLIRQYTQPQKQDVIVLNGQQKHVVLPDGSQVWLNSGSQLSYDKDFLHKDVREVLLSGEAFFDVQHDPKHTFIIHTRYIDIKDIGTRFNVKAYPEDDQVETTLLKGEVEVYRKDNPEKTVHLKPNEKIIFQAKSVRSPVGSKSTGLAPPGQANKAASDVQGNMGNLNTAKNSTIPAGFFVTALEPAVQAAGSTLPIITETAWMEHQLVFNGQRFSQLAKNMERWYDVNITFDNPRAAAFVFTGIFKEESVQEALRELQMIQSFRYKRSGKEILIY